MTKTITYKDISDSVKLEASNLMLKVEAVESLLANHQTEKATFELSYRETEQFLLAEKNNLFKQIRLLQTATMK